MPAPIDPADAVPADRARLALYYLGRARRSLLDARPYLAGTDAGRNFEGQIAAGG